jgi:ATP-dependent Lhr-like helicase
MDIAGLEAILGDIEAGRVRLVARDLREPSPLAQEVLHARPYAYLDDAPLEERRTQAVYSRRWLDPATVGDLGDLDAAAITRVREESWPQAAGADEVHDALVLLGYLTQEEARTGNGPPGWERHLHELAAARRAAVLRAAENGPRLWIAAERLPHLLAAFPGAAIEPAIRAPRAPREAAADRETAVVEILRGRLEGVGPAAAESLASSSGLPPDDVEAALLRLESEGFVLRGRFTPGCIGSEWCARRLLARIHRYTIDRLRREIEPVETADFIRFLLAWQRAVPDQRADGAESLAALLDQLEGYEAPAGAWESEILPARLRRYDPAWLDALCLSGRFVWGRFTAPRPSHDGAGAAAPLRSTPIAFLRRINLPLWAGPAAPEAEETAPSADARLLRDLLAERGASFFEDLTGASGLLKSQAEQALGELVARGLATADGFSGLRALLSPAARRRRVRDDSRRRGAVSGMEAAGRWSGLRAPAGDGGTAGDGRAAAAGTIAPVLLRRYGVVFKRMLEREGLAPPWRDLLRALRRLEARGEIRGGRFVAGVQGEQFALPDAVGLLRSLRRSRAPGDLVTVSAADPLNLIGILTPGHRIPPVAASRILYRDGVPVAIREAGDVRCLAPLEGAALWQVTKALSRGPAPLPGPADRPAERLGAL